MRGLTSLAAARVPLSPRPPDCGSECFPHPSSEFFIILLSAKRSLHSGWRGAREMGADGRA